jgi:protein-S-isoprenylcysteine O-methyltransferase Ste14
VALRSFTRILKAAAGGLYLLVFLEAFYMVSFLGLYLAAVYAPVERLLDHHPATSWLLSFYLPHFYRSSLGPLNIGTYMVSGMLVWFVGLWISVYSALQVYGTKLAGGRIITRGFYRWVRHPQYLAFMIMPIPFLVIWPRYLLLGMYVALVIFYLNLAHREEKICVRRYGEAYRQYQRSTSMFIPGIRIERIFSPILASSPGSPALRRLSVVALGVGGTITALWLTASLGKVWASRIPQIRQDAAVWVPLYHGDQIHLPRVKGIIEEDGSLQNTLARARADGARSFYVLTIPFQEWHFFLDYAGSLNPKVPWSGSSRSDYWVHPHLLNMPRSEFRTLVFFASPDPPSEEGNALFSILFHAGRWSPRWLAGIDLKTGRVVSRVRLQDNPNASTSTLRLPML